MPKNESVAFFGLAQDIYSDIARVHLEQNFERVYCFWGTNHVPPLDEPQEFPDVDWLFCFKSKKILRAKTLNSIRKAAVNFHTASPDYPGSNGVNWALYNGDTTSAITTHLMTTDVDAGPILDTAWFTCADANDVNTLLTQTYTQHLLTFMDITRKIAFEGIEWVNKAQAAYDGPSWASHTYRVRELEELKRIQPDMCKTEIARRIRATRYRNYGPYIELEGYKFRLGD